MLTTILVLTIILICLLISALILLPVFYCNLRSLIRDAYSDNVMKESENAEVLEDINKSLEQMTGLKDTVDKLSNGLCPDYEAAKKANDEVNKFNMGIGNILGFDPMEALKASRSKEGDSN